MQSTSDNERSPEPDITSTSGSAAGDREADPQLTVSTAASEPQPQMEIPSHSSHSSDASNNSNTGQAGSVCENSGKRRRSGSHENENDNCSGEADDGDNASEISDFSNFSQESWQPVQGPIAWVQEQMRQGQSPRKILEDLVPAGTMIPEGLDPIMLWKIIINIVSEPPKRKKLHDINTLDDVLHLLKTCSKIVVLTGAGVSVSCGIPDFRSRNGVYARLAKDFPNLPDPQAMFDIHFFRNDPRPFFKFAKEIYPGQFQPSLCHHFIKLLEDKGKLLRNYTQNIDTLEQVAGIQRAVQCHGSFATATCAVCGHKVDSSVIKDDIFNQVIPHCVRCSPSNQSAVMKPDIVFFGESLPEHFHNQMAADKDECDLLIVIGSSLKVRPVALIPNSLPPNVPQVLINRERLHYLNFDVELLGNCDDIVGELCRRLGPGWDQLAAPGPPLNEVIMSNLPTPPVSPPSGESRDRWDDVSNPAISSSEVISCSENTPAFSSVSKHHPDHDAQEAKTTNALSVVKAKPQEDKDGGVPEVSTSQSDTALSKSHREHHHKHSTKRPFALLSSSSIEDNIPPQERSDSSEGAEGMHNTCSSEEVETLVSACHKRDVMYMPSEKASHGHHGQSSSHTHHSHHSRGHHHGQTVASDTALAPSHHHHGQSSVQHQVSSPTNHNSGQLTPQIQHGPHSSSKSSSHFSSLKETQCSTSEVVEVGTPQECSRPPEADSQEEDNEEESCSDSKRPRLSREAEVEADSNSHQNRNGSNSRPFEDRSTNDSVSQEGSLDDIRKMWQSKRRVSLAQRLAENQVLYLPPSRYVFKGAEVFSESESEDSESDDDDDDDSSIDSDMQEPQESAVNTSDKTEGDGSFADSSEVACVPSDDHTSAEHDSGLCATVDTSAIPASSGSEQESSSSVVVTDNSHSSDFDAAQPSNYTSQPNIPHTKTSIPDTDSSASCPVSSTDDLHLEHGE